MGETDWSIFSDFFDEGERRPVVVEPLLGYHLQQEPVQLLQGGQRLHLEGAAGAVDQVVLARSSLESEPQSSEDKVTKLFFFSSLVIHRNKLDRLSLACFFFFMLFLYFRVRPQKCSARACTGPYSKILFLMAGRSCRGETL